MDSSTGQQIVQANNYGVAFTSSNPLTGYRYAAQQSIISTLPDWSSSSSILPRVDSTETSSPTCRMAASGSSTAVSSGSDSDTDTEVASTSAHTRRQRSQDGVSASCLVSITPSSARSILSPFTASPITLLVGGPDSPSKEDVPVAFYVHESVVTAVSPFFRAAFDLNLRHGFSERMSRQMKLPEDRPEDFAFLLQWVYWKVSNEVTGAEDAHACAGTGLRHPSIDLPLAEYNAYRERRRAERSLVEKVKEECHNPVHQLALGLPFASANGMQPLQAQVPSDGATENIESIESTTDTLAEKQRLRRPAPPAFGPLIRLYTLADKYILPPLLKRMICTRVRDVGREGRCVPDANDVALLWDSVVEEAGVEERSRDNDNLKTAMLDMYAGLSVKSFKVLFLSTASKEDARDGDGQGGTPTPEADRAWQWHPVFMRDLMARMFEKANGKERKENGIRKGRSLESLVRARRSERFPSLYGVHNLSGEEGLGGSS
jgi:BTB/POZ domain